MKKSILCISFLITGILLLPLYGSGEEGGSLSGKAGITVRTIEGERESSMFEKYREVPEGVSGEVDIKYRPEEGYFLELKAKDIAEDDQRLNLRAGRYGKYRIELIYDKIPHRFAYDARTLYTGIGTGNLVISDRIQADLQVPPPPPLIGLASEIRDYFVGAFLTDVELFRKTGKVNLDLMALDPLNFRAEFKREEREGTRPFSGAFAILNIIEIPEPIDYETDELRLIAEYAKKPLYLNLTYYLSIFENNIDTLIWDNPFRAVDTAVPALPVFLPHVAGASRGLIDLHPNNTYQNISLKGALSNLPLKSRLSVIASRGWMEQGDPLVPYTTNIAIATPPLPQTHVDAKVNTSLYNVLLTSNPLNFMNLKARYRYYQYDNKTGVIHFPGYVLYDAIWRPVPKRNLPTGYKKSTAGIDLSFDIFNAATLGLGYTFENTKRKHREVADQDDNIYKLSLDTSPLPWLDLSASYERSKREGVYDYRVPFEGATITSQLPWLRKYDMANRDRDRVEFLAILYPVEPITITGSAIFGKDDFKDSPFGLLDDRHNIYSLDVDYAVSERLNLYAYYSFEEYKHRMKARQWAPFPPVPPGFGIGNPYFVETTYESYSNWEAEGKDRVNTLGGGMKFAIMPKKLDFKLTYSYSKTNGKIKLSSPLGVPDLNPFIPLDFTEVDDTKFQTLDANLKGYISKGLSVTLGYTWEKFDIKDFTTFGFEHIPTTIPGAYQGLLLMGTLPQSYNVNMVYTKLTYNF